jgi:hypothetical protein
MSEHAGKPTWHTLPVPVQVYKPMICTMYKLMGSGKKTERLVCDQSKSVLFSFKLIKIEVRLKLITILNGITVADGPVFTSYGPVRFSVFFFPVYKTGP